MICIDHAGWGMLIGGLVIGVYDSESGRFEHGVIPPECFQDQAFEQEAYQQEAARLIAEIFWRLQVGNDTPIQCGAGYVLNQAEETLRESGYTVQRTKVIDPLKYLLSIELQMYLRQLGFEIDRETLTNHAEYGRTRWWLQVKWLKGGNPERSGYVLPRAEFCKTGRTTWSIWAKQPYSVATQLAAQHREQRRERRRLAARGRVTHTLRVAGG